MDDRVDGIHLDKDNVEFNNAAEFVRHTDKLIYLTGKAGTGKTTFLKFIKKTTQKNTVVLAPTGVAAINAGGVTIHSFFQIPFGPFVPGDSRLRTRAASENKRETIFSTFKYSEDKREIIHNLELLIIDEISMVRADLLDVIDRILRVYRKKPQLPFGGVQVILIGDTFQLPPIADNEQWAILSQYYKTPFFFSSKVIEQITPLYIELKKIYRQSEQEFIDLLNRVRVSRVSSSDIKLLNKKCDPSFSGSGGDYIILATHNQIVNDTNLKKLAQLETELHSYEATITGTFPEKHRPTDRNLKLKVGAQIMFVKNDSGDFKRFFNGKIGKIKALTGDSIRVVFDDESEVEVERAIWENIRYTYDKEKKKIIEEVVGTFTQYPIRLAWAITVHKSQGLTFEKVIADLGKAFAPGQVYVALSRCTALSGLMLKSQINAGLIKTDPRVIDFARNETPGTLITEQLNAGKADFFYKKAREDFGLGDIVSAFEQFKRALKFRNDIDTDIFQKFIAVQGKRLFGYKSKYEAGSKLLDSVHFELKGLKDKLILRELEIDANSVLIKEQKSHIEQLQGMKGSLEVEVENLNMELDQRMKKFAASQSRLKALRAKLKKVESQSKKLRKEITFDKAEIERLSNLKWYHKLFGRG